MSGRAARAAKRRKFKTLDQLLKELFVTSSTQYARMYFQWEAFVVQEGERLTAELEVAHERRSTR